MTGRMRDCPYCGSGDVYLLCSAEFGYGPVARVVCSTCDARGPRWSLAAAREAVAAWNSAPRDGRRVEREEGEKATP